MYGIARMGSATGSVVRTTVVDASEVRTRIPATNMKHRKAIMIYNNSDTSNIYIGNSTVTATGSTKGLKLHPHGYFPLDISMACKLYAICESSKTAEIITFEVNNE